MKSQRCNLILASASPRRRDLLTQAGYQFTVESCALDESTHHMEQAEPYVLRLAEQKARTIFARHPKVHMNDLLIVLGADTTVVCDQEILGKPFDRKDALSMLRALSGRTHQVLTGLAVVTRDRIFSAVESTMVTFSDIPEPELEFYCATSEPLDKAGAYGIQGYAARWIPRIDGCYFNVMGLPIARTVRLIEESVSLSIRRVQGS